jgi:hypothetical protein
VAVYGFAVWQCLRVTREQGAMPRQERQAWHLITLVMVLLAITRLFDWPAIVVDFARSYTVRHGWYAMRSVMQIGAIALVAVSAAVGVAVLLKNEHGLPRAAVIALCSTFLLLAFFTTRAVSLHAVDVVFGLSIAGVRLHWMIEIAGILAVCLGARMRLRASKTRITRSAPNG